MAVPTSGMWSKSFINHSPGATFYTFEPASATYSQLIENISGSKNIIPVNMGMSEKSGFAKLFTNSAGSGLASLTSRRLDHFNIFMEESKERELGTIDGYVTAHGITPTIVKLDVEGHELPVLNDANQTLSRIPHIQFEFGGCNLDSRTTFQDFLYFFSENNFSIYRLGPRGIFIVSENSEICEIYMITITLQSTMPTSLTALLA